MTPRLTLLLLALFLAAACDGGDGSDADAGDGSADGDVDSDADAEPEWCDDTSGLCWQVTVSETSYAWENAISYCDGLTYAGSSDWRLPTIGELRTLVRGCPGTVTGGECPITESCSDDVWVDACDGCEYSGGPGVDYCYWDTAMGGECHYPEGSNWSSSENTRVSPPSHAWFIDYTYAHVDYESKDNENRSRCVRTGP